MKSRQKRLRHFAATTGVVALAACSAPAARVPETVQGIHHANGQTGRIVQVDYGADAIFASCAEPACPERTTKTLAVGTEFSAVAYPIGDVEHPGGRLVAWGRLRQAESPPPPPLVEHTESISVRFPFAAAALTPQARQSLLSALPLARRADQIVISGRTDGAGPQAANDRIAALRAAATRDFLRAQLGDSNPPLVIDAKGACCFVADNQTPAGRAQNRRVDVIFKWVEGDKG